MKRVLFALALLLAPVNPHYAAEAQAKKPNVIYILIDELGYYEPAFMGGRNIRTPNLDRMASEGVRFNNLFAGSRRHLLAHRPPRARPPRQVRQAGRARGCRAQGQGQGRLRRLAGAGPAAQQGVEAGSPLPPSSACSASRASSGGERT